MSTKTASKKAAAEETETVAVPVVAPDDMVIWWDADLNPLPARVLKVGEMAIGVKDADGRLIGEIPLTLVKVNPDAKEVVNPASEWGASVANTWDSLAPFSPTPKPGAWGKAAEEKEG